MKLARAKEDLTWLQQPEYDILIPLWEKRGDHKHNPYWTYVDNQFGFRRIHYRDKGRGTTVQQIRFIIRQNDKKLQVDIINPNTGMTTTAVLPLDDLPSSPRQFQKRVFVEARGDQNTLSAGKTNLRVAWKEFLETIEQMPVVEPHELHIDNTDEGWLE